MLLHMDDGDLTLSIELSNELRELAQKYGYASPHDVAREAFEAWKQATHHASAHPGEGRDPVPTEVQRSAS